MNFDEALQYAIDNKINFQFRRIDGKVILIAYDFDCWTPVVDKITWTFKKAFKSAILPALNRIKNREP